jgi:hypothetical protein
VDESISSSSHFIGTSLSSRNKSGQTSWRETLRQGEPQNKSLSQGWEVSPEVAAGATARAPVAGLPLNGTGSSDAGFGVPVAVASGAPGVDNVAVSGMEEVLRSQNEEMMRRLVACTAEVDEAKTEARLVKERLRVSHEIIKELQQSNS